MHRTSRCLMLAVLALCAATPAAATAAGAFDTIFSEYQRTGSIDACKFTPKQLADAKRKVPNDIEQYAPDFSAALEAASEQRAAKRCAKTAAAGASGNGAAGGGAAPGGGSGAAGAGGSAAGAMPGAAPPAGAAPAPGTPGAPNVPGQTPSPAGTPKAAPAASDRAIQAAAARGRDDGVPLAPLIALGALLLLALLVAAARWWAWEPRFLARTRHVGGEAGWRLDNAWSEFADWVRTGH